MSERIDRRRDRLAIAMWEFSWLVRRTGSEAEYADWGAVLDVCCQESRIFASVVLVADSATVQRGVSRRELSGAR